MGVPEVKTYWDNITKMYDAGLLKGDEKKKFKRLVKALVNLSNNPKHNSLSTHEIKLLIKRFGIKVWQKFHNSYLYKLSPDKKIHGSIKIMIKCLLKT